MGTARFGDEFRYGTSSSFSARQIVTKTTLTNDQIKALPTAPITISDTPASGQLIVPALLHVKIDCSNGVYTNIDAASYLYAGTYVTSGSPDVVTEQALSTPVSPGVGEIFATASEVNAAILFPIQPYVITNVDALYALPWALTINNDTNGNLTGGHASNSGVVHFAYYIFG